MKHQHTSQLALILIGALSAAAGQAAETNFIGPAVGVRLAALHNEVDYGGFLAGSSSAKNDTGFDVFAAYGLPLSGDWIANVGVNYTLNKTDFGTVTYIDGGAQTVSARLKSHWSVFVAPGYRFAPQWQAYAKFSYHNARGEYTDSQLGKNSVTTNGFGYGAGLSYAVTRNIEASFELQQIDFSRETANLSNGEPSVTEAALQFAYRF
jgi:opacity protein-like surface antigen